MLRCMEVERKAYLNDLGLRKEAQVVSLEFAQWVIVRFCSRRQTRFRGTVHMIYCTSTHLKLMHHRHGRAAERAEGCGGAWVATVQRLHSSCPQTLQPQQQAPKSTKPEFVEFD